MDSRDDENKDREIDDWGGDMKKQDSEVIPVSRFFDNLEDMNSDDARVTHLEEGHINQTYQVALSCGTYIFQKVRNLDEKILSTNYNLIQQAREGFILQGFRAVRIPDYQKCKRGPDQGKYFSSGWRCYPLLEGTVASSGKCDAYHTANEVEDLLESPKEVESIEFLLGKGLSSFHAMLSLIPEKGKRQVESVVPHFHETEYYLSEYDKTLESLDVNKSIDESEEKLQELFSFTRKYRYLAGMRKCFPSTQVIHGDPKLGNIIVSSEGEIAFIDLDTVMLGNPILDLADLLRSALVSSLGDEALLQKKYKEIVSGYKSDWEQERHLKEDIQNALKLICFELGVRYLTDYISDGTYFPESYPMERLDKARKQFRLIEELRDGFI